MQFNQTGGFGRLAKKTAFLCLPLLLLAQYLGNIPNKSLWGTAVYLAVFLSVLWLTAPLTRPAKSTASGIQWFGMGLAAVGAVVYIGGLARIVFVDLLGMSGIFINALVSDQTARLLRLLVPWPLSIGWSLVAHRRVRPTALVRIGMLVALACLASMVAGQTYQGRALFGQPTPVLTGCFGVAAICLIGLAGATPRRRWIWAVCLLLPALALRGFGLESWAIDPAVRDMLALVTSAHDSFLTGHNPYQLHQMQEGSVVPLTYLPGMWLSYLAPRLAGLDIRWMGVAADAVIVSSLWMVGWKTARSADGEVGWTWPQAASMAFGAVWLFLPSVHWNGIYAEPHVWWAALALLLATATLRRWWLAAAVLGLVVTMRHFGVVVLPFVVWLMWRDLGWRQMVARLSVTGAVAAVLLVPFVAWNPETFWFGTFRWLREYGPAHQNWFYAKFGLAGLFYKNNIAAWLPIGQILAVIGCLVVAVMTRANTRRCFGLVGTAYVLFVMFNGLIWYSFYLGAALVVAFAACQGAHTPRSTPVRLDGWAFRACCLVLALATLGGGWLGYTLYEVSARPGLPEMRHFLASRVEPGDTIIDRSDWEVEFVDGRPLFESDQRPRRVRLVSGVFDSGPAPLRRLMGTATSSKSLWLVTRSVLPNRHVDDFKHLGRVEADRTFGAYRVIRLAAWAVQNQLTDSVASLQPFFDPRGTAQPIRMRKKQPDAPAGDDNAWTADGQPSWVRVTPKRCEMDTRSMNMLYAHPNESGAVRLRFADIEFGTSLLVFGGVESPVVRWERGDVQVAVQINGQPVGAVDFPNRPGPHWGAFSTRRWRGDRGSVELLVTTDDDRQRWTCLDAAVLAANVH